MSRSSWPSWTGSGDAAIAASAKDGPERGIGRRLLAGWGSYAAVSVDVLDLLSATVLVECVLADWRKVPFTCGHVPDAESLRSR